MGDRSLNHYLYFFFFWGGVPDYKYSIRRPQNLILIIKTGGSLGLSGLGFKRPFCKSLHDLRPPVIWDLMGPVLILYLFLYYRYIHIYIYVYIYIYVCIYIYIYIFKTLLLQSRGET